MRVPLSAIWYPMVMSWLTALIAVGFALVDLYWITLALTVISGIMLIDVINRGKDYKGFMSSPREDPMPRIKALRHSRCGRELAVSMYDDTARVYYRENGYRWWHLAPSGFPVCLARPTFWRSFMGRVPEERRT